MASFSLQVSADNHSQVASVNGWTKIRVVRNIRFVLASTLNKCAEKDYSYSVEQWTDTEYEQPSYIPATENMLLETVWYGDCQFRYKVTGACSYIYLCQGGYVFTLFVCLLARLRKNHSTNFSQNIVGKWHTGNKRHC